MANWASQTNQSIKECQNVWLQLKETNLKGPAVRKDSHTTLSFLLFRVLHINMLNSLNENTES